MKKFIYTLIISIFIVSCGGKISKKEVFSEVTKLANEGKCDDALSFFSKRVKDRVAKRIENGGTIEDWCEGWKVSDALVKDAMKDIENGNYDNFVEEEGEWKLDDL